MRMRLKSEANREGSLVRRHRPDYQIVLFAGLLLVIGLIVVYSISFAHTKNINANGNTLDAIHFMEKQAMYLGIGVAAFITAAMVPLSFWAKHAAKFVVLGLALSLFLALFGLLGIPLAMEAGGAYRWYNLGFITFQPAEILKFSLLVFVAAFLGNRIAKGRVNDLHATLIPLVVLLGISMLFVIGFQKDMGTGITLIGIVASMLFMAGLNKKFITLGAIGMVAVGIFFIIIAPHRIERVVTFLDASKADAAQSYHIDQAQTAIGNGGLTGKGLGQSVSAFGYVPEALNDSIFAILGETFGFIGLVAIIAIFFGLLFRLLHIVDHVANPMHRMLVAGVFGWIATHTVVNIAAMIGVFPLTGVTLPFVSFGGTSLLFMLSALGIAFHVSRYTSHQIIDQSDKERKQHENSRGRRGLGRTRYASNRGY